MVVSEEIKSTLMVLSLVIIIIIIIIIIINTIFDDCSVVPNYKPIFN